METNQQVSGAPVEPGKVKTKGKWILWLIGAVIVVPVLISMIKKEIRPKSISGGEQQSPVEEIAEVQRNEGEVNSPEDNESISITYKELGSYEKAGDIWKSIVISNGTSREDLIKLANDIQKKDPSYQYHIFDDDTKFQEYKDWDINYGKIKDKDGKIKDIGQCIDIEYCRSLISQGKYAYPYPEEWVNKHYIASIQQMFTENKKLEWGLYDLWGELISKL